MREKKRYIAFEVWSEGELDRRGFVSEFMEVGLALLGERGFGEIGCRVLDFDGCFGVLRCRRGFVELGRAILAAIVRVEGVRVGVRVLGVSGTVKGASRKIEACKNRRENGTGECGVRLGEVVCVSGVSGRVVRVFKNEIDISPLDLFSRESVNRAATRNISVTVFDDLKKVN